MCGTRASRLTLEELTMTSLLAPCPTAPSRWRPPPQIDSKPGSTSPRHFRIDGMLTDNNWRIYVMALTKVSGSGTPLHSLTTFRRS